MLRKKEVYTVVTPIPSFIPRQLAIDILHSHSEVITLNPLVLEHKAIPAPQNAAADEYYSTWYEISERIQFVPGMGKMGSSRISFNGCFHDMPWGLQTHIYAPMGVDLRNRYRIAGNQPGEPPEVREIGLENLGAPADGLYLREDIEIKCNLTMVSFVKAQCKAASKEMVQRIIKKAELLDSGVLQGMMENGRLRTINPNDRSRTGFSRHSPHPSISSISSPIQSISSPLQSSNPNYVFNQYQQPQQQQQQYQQRPGTAGSHYGGTPIQQQPPPMPYGQFPPQQLQFGGQQQQYQGYAPQFAQDNKALQQFPMELPGDFHYAQHTTPPPAPPQPSPGLRPPPLQLNRSSSSSSDPRWSNSQASPPLSADNYRTSMSSVASSVAGSSSVGVGSTFSSPGFPPQGYGYAAELPSHRETVEEHKI
ncbi:hypothetical protein B0I35DRAFT_423789 [Stachybotrys elegans]|uniref:DUF7053 domain-containing protein n=1 Tax=Stachybotrys elegans TaxID=80388 RepID=A0A8K0SV18_9HYPO|nr:hypothetical protein B0I35DRAFT_423789 [Stachybotrys elegans]